MNCEDVRASHLADLMGADERRHLNECAACRAQVPPLEAGRSAFADPSLWEEPSPELAAQVSSLIAGSAVVEGTTTAPGGRAAWPRWVWPALGVAAVALAAVVTIASLSTPAADWEVAVAGTDAAPAASATVRGWNTASGTRMVVDVDGLEPAPAGYMYEFWLSEGPVHVSAGTFRSGGEIVLWTGVTRAEFPRLWITLEPVDEDESPSGLTVLDTEV